jgi:hypothetical protein
VALPAAILAQNWLESEQALVFGCEPDYNAWTREMNVKPVALNAQLRSAGLHVHFGYDNPDNQISEDIIRTCDLFLGVPSILLEPDNDRRSLYGKAGAFRFKDYGAEYRTLSGYFAINNDLLGWVFDNSVKVIDFVNDERMDEVEAAGPLIQHAINNCDKTAAANLIRQFEIPMP